MTTAELNGQVVLVTGLKFKCLKAFDYGNGDYGLMGFWLQGDDLEPETPKIEQVIVPVQLISSYKP